MMNNKPKIKYYKNRKVMSKKYYKNEKFHREDGPAIIVYHENKNVFSETYFISGKYHREDGPAYIMYYENGDIFRVEYYLNGTKLSRDDWYSRLSVKSKLKLMYGLEDE